MEVPGRVEMRAVVGGERYLLDRPALPIRQVFRLQPVEELQHARQALLVIDVLDGRVAARRIGRHVVLQGNGDVDQLARHGGSSLCVLVACCRQTLRPETYASCRSTRFFKIPIFSTSSSMLSPCSRYQPS